MASRKKSTPPQESPPAEASPRSQKSQAPARSPERFIEDKLLEVRGSTQVCLDELAGHARAHPHQALLSAVGVGYLLRVLPTTRLLRVVLRLVFALLKPAVLIYGVSKLWEVSQKSSSESDLRENQ